jgi:hypothetical protein
MKSELVATAFASAQIAYAEVVDDSFNDAPGGLELAAVTTFLGTLDDLDPLCGRLGLSSGATEDQIVAHLQTRDGANAFYPIRAEFGAAAETLFADFVNETNTGKQKLEPLLKLLADCKVVTRASGADYEPGEQAPDIIFIDLKLRPGTSVVDLQLPLRVIKQVRDKFPNANPVVFLMSSLVETLEERREDFRKGSDLFSTQFETLRKDDLDGNRSKVVRQLIDMAGIKPLVDQVAAHAVTWDKALTGAQKELRTILRDMDVPDYLVLRDATAEHEGVGLGSYVTDLLLEFVSHHTEGAAELGKFISDLNAWDVKTLLRTRFHPRPVVSHVYQANTLCHVARLQYERDAGLGVNKGKLRLGDIFVSAELENGIPKKAVVVMSPECDLVRMDQPKHGMNVLLCEGEVKLLKPNQKFDGVPTQIILAHSSGEGEPAKELIITWTRKFPVVWEKAQVEGLSGPASAWRHVGRLRPLYALELQRILTSELSRVGVQPRPVTLSPHLVVLLVREGNKWVEKVKSDPEDLTQSAVGRGQTQTVFIINDICFSKIWTELEKWVEGQDQQDALVKNLAAVLQSDNTYACLRHARLPKPKDGKGVYQPLAVDGNGLQGDAYNGRTLVEFVRSPDGKDGGFKSGADAPTEKSALVVLSFVPIVDS